jgi:CAAX protease family protein
MPSVPPPSMTESAAATPAPAPAPERVPWGVWTAPAAIVLGLALGEVMVIVVEIIGRAGGSSFAHPTPAVSLVSDVVVDLGFVAAAIYFAVILAKGRATDFGFRRIAWRLGIGAFVLGGVSYYIVTFVYASVLGLHGQDKLPSELGVHRSTAALIGAAAFVCVIAPLAEEFFFRGFIFGALRRWRVRIAGHDIGTWLAALVTGILFGLAHTASASPQ